MKSFLGEVLVRVVLAWLVEPANGAELSHKSNVQLLTDASGMEVRQ